MVSTKNEKRRCVIVGGAPIMRPERVREYLKEDDFVICCDSGLRHCGSLGIRPDLIVGDFDSHERPETDRETIVLPCEKDDTDTAFAAKEALARGFRDFLLLGVIGGRLDHTLGNVSILQMLSEKGAKALAADDYSDMQIVDAAPVSVDGRCRFFSVLAVCGPATGVRIEDAKYPLEGAVITCEYQYGISNEIVEGRTAKVSAGEGRLLLIQVFEE